MSSQVPVYSLTTPSQHPVIAIVGSDGSVGGVTSVDGETGVVDLSDTYVPATGASTVAGVKDFTSPPTINGVGISRVNEGPLSAFDPRVGAVGDYVADDTDAFLRMESLLATGRGNQAFIPPGHYKTSAPIIITTGNQVWGGAGKSATQIQNTTGDVFQIGDAGHTGTKSYLRFENLGINASAGHVFKVHEESNVNLGALISLALGQQNTGKSIWHQVSASASNGGYIDMLVLDVELAGLLTHTVPLWHLATAVGSLSRNTWQQMRVTNTGNYAFWIEELLGGSYAYDNVFRDINFEVTNGGNIMLKSAVNCVLENLATYDLSGATTKDLYVLEKSATSPSSRTNTFRNVNRRGGSLGSGLVDIKVANTGGAGRNTIERCNGTIDLDGTTGNALRDMPYGFGAPSTTINNRGTAIEIPTSTTTLASFPAGVEVQGAGGPFVGGGTGSPEGVVTAPIGSVWLRGNGAAGTTLYLKESGAGNTGWVAMKTSGSTVRDAYRGQLATIDGPFNPTAFTMAASNDALLVKVKVSEAFTLGHLIWAAGASSGNYDIGLYDSAGTKLWSKGSTAWPSANTVVDESVTATPLAEGATVWAAFAADNTTGAHRGLTLGFLQQAYLTDRTGIALRYTSSFPLPSSFNLAAPTIISIRVPHVVLTQ